MTQPSPTLPLPQSPALFPRSLPPSERDFEIYHAIHIAGESTRSLAGLYEISQTRVRQIVRRVVEWLAQVLPPQTDIAKDQEVHLARQIAADRFQHQLEEATESWRTTKESKYASLRMRLIVAQARLGVVGGRIDGLAADAIEGLPVPIGTDNTGSAEDLVTGVLPGNALPRGSSLADSPETANYSVQDAKRAVSLTKSPYDLADTSLADALAEANSVLRAGAILLQEQPLAPAEQKIKNPPPGDCSPNDNLQSNCETVAALPKVENQNQLPTYDQENNAHIAHSAASSAASQPLLTSPNYLPVTEIQLTANQQGASISTGKLIGSIPSASAPCPPPHSTPTLVP